MPLWQFYEEHDIEMKTSVTPIHYAVNARPEILNIDIARSIEQDIESATQMT